MLLKRSLQYHLVKTNAMTPQNICCPGLQEGFFTLFELYPIPQLLIFWQSATNEVHNLFLLLLGYPATKDIIPLMTDQKMSISLQPKVPLYCNIWEAKETLPPLSLSSFLPNQSNKKHDKKNRKDIVQIVGQQSNRLQWDSVVWIIDTMGIHQE